MDTNFVSYLFCPHSYLSIMQNRLTLALDERFDDLDEVKDVARYGCSGGVSGFIYYYETRRFFDEYEEEIELELYNIYGDDWFKEIASLPSIVDTNQFKNYCVWLIVEDYCFRRSEAEEAALEVA